MAVVFFFRTPFSRLLFITKRVHSMRNGTHAMLPSLARFFLGLRKSDSGPGSTKAESYGPASCGIWGALISIAAAEDVGHFLIEEDVVKKGGGVRARVPKTGDSAWCGQKFKFADVPQLEGACNKISVKTILRNKDGRIPSHHLTLCPALSFPKNLKTNRL